MLLERPIVENVAGKSDADHAEFAGLLALATGFDVVGFGAVEGLVDRDALDGRGRIGIVLVWHRDRVGADVAAAKEGGYLVERAAEQLTSA